MNGKLHFRIKFTQSWILSKRGSKLLPADWLAGELKKQYSATGVKTRLTECEGFIDSDAENLPADLKSRVEEMLVCQFGDDSTDAFTVEVSEYTEPAPEEAAAPAEPETAPAAEPKAANEKKAPEPPKKTALEKINALVGAADFKALAAEINEIAPGLIANNITDSFTSRAYIVSINDGYGLTTYLELFADLVSELGLFEITAKNKVAEVRLNPPDSRVPPSELFSPVLDHFTGRNAGKIICIDISEWMTVLNEKLFRDLLRSIDEHTGENIVFFRVPFVEKNIVSDIVASLNDLLFVRDISITPFSGEELVRCAASAVADKGYEMADDAWDVFNARVASEKSDGRFYGINTVNKIIREMLYTKQLYNIRNSVDDRTVKRDEIIELANGYLSLSNGGLEQLSELIGMEEIRRKVEEIIAQIEAALSNDKLDTPCIHMRFVGNPGTGKTTVARIVGQVLKEKGILRNGSFFEHSGRDLCGRYVGETAPKTAAICRDAYGSVLFIDEAYSLYRDEGYATADYGREAIDTLVAEMENHRTDLMVIMAGYPDEMEKLMHGNIGLKSRMPYQLDFPNYTREQLAEIFFCTAKKNFTYDEQLEDAVRTYFDTLSDKVVTAKDFSNARYVRNLFERTWGKAALRCQMSSTPCTNLTVDDFTLAASDKEFSNILETKKQRIGFNK
ncbi:MAG: AAA family ATPase [Ruminococcus sp.]|nr:AAA family ATPase [Ruminococcus sp.]